MLLPQSSAFAALKNRLNSVSAIGYLHIAPRTTYVSSHVRQKSTETKFNSGPPSSSTSTSTSFDRPNRLKPRDDAAIKWNELLEKFKSVQEKAKRANNRARGSGGEEADGGGPFLKLTPGETLGGGGGGTDPGSQKALPEVPRQMYGSGGAVGGRPTSAESAGRPGQANPLPQPPVSVQKSKSSLGHLGRFAGNVAGRKGKK